MIAEFLVLLFGFISPCLTNHPFRDKFSAMGRCCPSEGRRRFGDFIGVHDGAAGAVRGDSWQDTHCVFSFKNDNKKIAI